MKKNEYGFMLLETLLVTIFVSGVLIFLFIQFSNLTKSYDKTFKYNTVEDLYALEDIKNFIITDSFYKYIDSNLSNKEYIDIKNCELFSDKVYCLNLFELENINKILITKNNFDSNKIKLSDEKFDDFINQIHDKSSQKYRIIASFNDDTYATIRFGE